MIWKKGRVPRKRILIAIGLAVAGYVALFIVQRPKPAPGSLPILVPALVEASGLTPSHRSLDLLWSHNDSKGQPILFGFAEDGSSRGMLRIKGAENVDWEAITSFELDGKAWIAVGDVGDNSGRRSRPVIHVIEEPAPDQLSPLRETSVAISWSIPYRYEHGPRDCETLLVDARRQELLLITKRARVPEIYRLALRPPPPSSVSVAKKVGTVGHLPQPDFQQKLFPVPAGRFRSLITDGAISPDGLSVAILTYGDVLIFSRAAGETWMTALQREPEQLSPHGLQQAEAISFSRDGENLYVTGEQRRPLLLRYSLPGAD